MQRRFAVDIIRTDSMWDVEEFWHYQMDSDANGISCKDPSSYISWDGVYFTEAANRWIANLLFNGSISDPPPPIPITHACYHTS
ncbi:hypothetical protein F3Y22_tig00113124pilonHSYRG00360 [Hibiscus syriacus]|uniref:Uncharacterized protein n=1 Tax=Hibiscus syriacus TaxID=106335 RepID=A0A6A2WRL9_HIBSY|nr:hypothetical protein F3Y22_tig00113124pilonHSYRG00360 [Hibiscus syriacus]